MQPGLKPYGPRHSFKPLKPEPVKHPMPEMEGWGLAGKAFAMMWRGARG